MKKLLMPALVFLVLVFLTAPRTFAQVDKTINDDFVFTVKLTNQNTGDIHYYNLQGVELIKVNKIGKILRVLTFRLSDNDIMELANPMIMLSIKSVTGDFDGDGEQETLDGQYATITKKGNLRIVYH